MLTNIIVLAIIFLAVYGLYRLDVIRNVNNDEIEKMKKDKEVKKSIFSMKWRKVNITGMDIYTNVYLDNVVSKTFELPKYFKEVRAEANKVMNSGECYSFDDGEKLFAVVFETLKKRLKSLKSKSAKAYLELITLAENNGFTNNLKKDGSLNKLDLEKGYFELIFTSKFEGKFVQILIYLVLEEKL